MPVLRDTFNTLGTSEAPEVLEFAYLFEVGATDVHAEPLAVVELDSDGDAPVESEQESWSLVVNELFPRFLTDYLLMKAYEEVTRAEQKEREDD